MRRTARGASLSLAMLAYARGQEPPVPLLLADAGRLPPVSGSCTAVTASFYVPHMAAPAAYLTARRLTG